MKTFDTKNGLQLLKDWSNNFEKYSQQATRDLKKALPHFDITHGDGVKFEDIFGLPYTSTSAFAGLWNCQATAKLKNTNLFFEGLAIDTNGETVFYLSEIVNGEDIGEKYLKINEIKKGF